MFQNCKTKSSKVCHLWLVIGKGCVGTGRGSTDKGEVKPLTNPPQYPLLIHQVFLMKIFVTYKKTKTLTVSINKYIITPLKLKMCTKKYFNPHMHYWSYYVLSCLWDGAYKRFLVANLKE